MEEKIWYTTDFIREAVKEDIASGKCTEIRTRFPPEPNGWLHIGHAKAIAVDFTVAAQFNGTCNLRFDDTNPEKEDMSYVEAIKRDVKWLGYDWEDREYFASDYYEYLRHCDQTDQEGKAYVDDLNDQEMREYRNCGPGQKQHHPHAPGKNSPWRTDLLKKTLTFLHECGPASSPTGRKPSAQR